MTLSPMPSFVRLSWSLVLLSLFTSPAWSETRDLVIVAGQSNAVGFDATPSGLPVDARDKDVMFWFRVGDPPPDDHDSTSARQWTTLCVQPQGQPMPRKAQPRQYGNYTSREGGFGPEMGFARAWMAHAPQPLAIVKAAFSGTGLRTDWDSSDSGKKGACYRALIDETRAAIIAAKEKGIELNPKALIWVQGESDANTEDAANYEANLTAMLATLRRDLEVPKLIALIAVNTRFGNGKNPHVATVIAAQKAVAAKDDRSSYVDTEGAETLPPSHTHFTAAGTLEIGRRFARALQTVAP